jgi:drug/metabolite transporter (DMT)-like permease
MFAAMSVIWGMPYLLIKIAVGGVTVAVLVLARVANGAALLLPLAIRRGQLGAIWAVWPWLALFAFVEVIVPWFLLSEAERAITSSLTGLLIAATPVIVAVIGLLIRTGDRLSGVRWAGLLIGLGGVVLLAGPHLIGPGASGGTARSVAEVLIVSVCYATGPVIAAKKLAGVPPIGMTAACLVLASVAYAPLAVLSCAMARQSSWATSGLTGLQGGW